MRGCALAGALLLLLSGLGGASASAAHAAGAVENPTAVSLDCFGHGEGRDRAPLGHCAHCYILCDCAAQLAGARAPNDAPPTLTLECLARRSPAAADVDDGVDHHPPGWASSWSSQAPPIVS